MNRSSRLLGQIAVIVPTVALSAYLGHIGMALGPRLIFSLGLGMVLIMFVAILQRRNR